MEWEFIDYFLFSNVYFIATVFLLSTALGVSLEFSYIVFSFLLS